MIPIANLDGIETVIPLFYIIAHSPAIIALFVGLSKLKTKPKFAKKVLIFSALYFIIGAGICGSMLG